MKSSRIVHEFWRTTKLLLRIKSCMPYCRDERVRCSSVSLFCWVFFIEISLPKSAVSELFFPYNHQTSIIRWAEWLRNRRMEYWATRWSVCSFARTAHSFAWSALLASLAHSPALTRSLSRSFRSIPCSWDSEWLDGYLFSVSFLFWLIVDCNPQREQCSLNTWSKWPSLLASPW